MREVECVRQDARQDEYLKKLLKNAGAELKFMSWSEGRYSSQSPLILMVDEDHIDALIEICEDREMKIIIALNSRREFKIVSKLKEQFNKIFGFIDLSQEIEYNTPLLLNYFNLNFSDHALNLEKLSNDLDKIYEFTQTELGRVKELHDRLVKVRVDQFKGVNVTSKFMAGENSGGEFFDMLQTDQNFLFIQAGTNSYILSSLILSEMEVLKLSTPTTSVKAQSEEFEKMITHHAKENNAELNYCIINVDLKTLQADFKFKGNGCFYFQNEVFDYKKPMTLKLKPSEKICLLSNGALKNLEKLNPKLSIKNFYSENEDKNTRDLINEFFFEVSRNKTGSFLIYDALMNVIEIDQKMLYQL